MTGNAQRSPHFLNKAIGTTYYRPISVISVMAKVFERIVYDQLYAYLEEHNIICKYPVSYTHLTLPTSDLV